MAGRAQPSTEASRRLDDVERWFMRRGTPHLTEDYSATADVFTRMLPVLTALAVVEVFGALDADFRWWQNLLAGIGGLALLLAVWAGINSVRGRPHLARPDRVGLIEIATFVLAPAVITYVISQQVGQALSLAAVNLALLGAIYLVTSYGLLPLTRWAMAKTGRELGAVAGLLGRALPLLLLIQIVLFINAEVWQVAAGFDGVSLGATVGLFFVIGVAFLVTRLPRELDRLATFASSDELADHVTDTPAEGLVDLGACSLEPSPLSARQRGNLLLVALFSQGLQVVLVTAVLGVFFVAFGLLTITPEVLAGWTGGPGDEVFTIGLAEEDLILTAELLMVSAFLASFSGLYFTVVLVTDATYREEFFDEILAELRQTFAVRAVYLCARSRSEAAAAGEHVAVG
jgi:ABC-type multidrug transport system fused ATPase/permease subunit